MTIDATNTEFGYQDTANTDSANFTGTTLTLTDVSNGGSLPINFVFTSSAFSGLALTELSDSFAGGGVNATLIGNVLTLAASSTLGTSGTFTAVYSFSSAAPEAGTWLMMILGFGFAGFAFRRRAMQTA